MASLDSDSKIEISDSKLEQTVGYHVKNLTQVPELLQVSDGDLEERERTN